MKKIKAITLILIYVGIITSCTDNVSNEDGIKAEYAINIPSELFPVEIDIFDGIDLDASFKEELSGYSEFLQTEFLQKILAGQILPKQNKSVNDANGTLEFKLLAGNFGYAIIRLNNQTFLIKKISNNESWNFSIADYSEIDGLINSLTLGANQIVFVKDDLTLNGTLTIETGSALIVESGKKIKVYAETSGGGENTIISSKYGKSMGQGFLNAELNGNSVTLDNIIVNGGLNGLQINNVSGLATINNSKIINNVYGLYIKNRNLSLANTYFHSNELGCLISQTLSGALINNWYTNNETGLHFESADLNISESLFHNNTIGLLPIFGNSSVSNSTFTNNQFGICLNTDSLEINENIFQENQKAIEFNRNYVQQSYSYSKVSPRNNNFINNNYHATVFGLNSASGPLENGLGIHEYQDFSNNYWIDQTEFTIKAKIIDGEDSDITDFNIGVNPFLENQVNTAGKM